MENSDKSLIEELDPKSNSIVLVYDVHASESGAKSILDDFYQQVINYSDKSIKWIFVTSVLVYKNTKNVKCFSYPWVKKSWLLRLFFEKVIIYKIIKKENPDIIFSLQNNGVSRFDKNQFVYLHLPFILTEHKFSIFKDGKRLWLYQNFVSKYIFKSLRNVDKIFVQTHWMKGALVKKAKIDESKIVVKYPNISINKIIKFEKFVNDRIRFFYPATPFTYKNHFTLLKALKKASDSGMSEYELILTINGKENKYSKKVYKYSQKNGLNVIFNGVMDRNSVFEMYSNSILIFPSYVESFGLPLLEAKMSNSIIFASNCSFCREILNGYDNVYYFDELDYNKLADEILLFNKKGK